VSGGGRVASGGGGDDGGDDNGGRHRRRRIQGFRFATRQSGGGSGIDFGALRCQGVPILKTGFRSSSSFSFLFSYLILKGKFRNYVGEYCILIENMIAKDVIGGQL